MPPTLPESLSPIAARLLSPAESVPLEALPGRWFHQRIAVRLAGAAAAAGEPGLPGRVRGAWGHRLMRAASDAALAGRPCPWDPPCAYDVLFREQGRITPGLAVPRPTVIAAGAVGDELEVALTLFGFACDWSAAAAEALVAALREGDPLRRGEAPPILRRTVETAEAVAVPAAARRAELAFFAPLVIRGDAPLAFDSPAGLVASLGNRVSALARWQDCRVEADWRALVDHAATLACDAGGLQPVRWRRGSARQGNRAIPMQGLTGRLVLDGDLAPLLPLLVLGATCHAGSHAALGLGGYTLTLEQ